jgi:hypothetical protein
MKKITMIAALALMTGTVLTMTGCKSMCKMTHGDGSKSSMNEAQCPAGCACDKCAAKK